MSNETIIAEIRGEKVEVEVVGRNWIYDHLESYIVRYKGMDVPVSAKSLKAQILV